MTFDIEKIFQFNTWFAILGLLLAISGNYFPLFSEKLDYYIRAIGIFCKKKTQGLFNPKKDICKLYFSYGCILIIGSYLFKVDHLEIVYFLTYSSYDIQTISDFIFVVFASSFLIAAGLVLFSPVVMVVIFVNAYLIQILRTNVNRSALSGIGILMATYSFLSIFIVNHPEPGNHKITLKIKAKTYLESKGYIFFKDGNWIHPDTAEAMREGIKEAEKNQIDFSKLIPKR